MMDELRSAQKQAVMATRETLQVQQTEKEEVKKYMGMAADAIAETANFEDQAENIIKRALDVAREEQNTAQALRVENTINYRGIGLPTDPTGLAKRVCASLELRLKPW